MILPFTLSPRIPGRAAVAWGLLFAAGSVSAAPLPAYQPAQKLHGVIRSWGSEEMAPLLSAWERGFARYQPEVLFLDTLKGSETAQAGLYTDVADLALMSRETFLVERYGLWVRKHHYPLEFTVATGSAENPDRTFALAIIVNRGNPLAGVTLRQLDGIFGEARSGGWDPVKFAWHTDVARGPEANLRTWGQLGLTGEWADQPIHLYGYPLTGYASPAKEQGAMYFFRNHVLAGADKWNFALHEYETGAEIARAVASDRFGIGYTALAGTGSGVKAIPVAAGAGAIPLTTGTVADRTYPLTRSVYICIDRTPGEPVDPKVAEFLRYVYSREGQAAIVEDGSYLPLTPEAARAELAKLD